MHVGILTEANNYVSHTRSTFPQCLTLPVCILEVAPCLIGCFVIADFDARKNGNTPKEPPEFLLLISIYITVNVNIFSFHSD